MKKKIKNSLVLTTVIATTILAACLTSRHLEKVELAEEQSIILSTFQAPVCIRIEGCKRDDSKSLHVKVVSNADWEYIIRCSEFGPGRSGRMGFVIGVTQEEMREIFELHDAGSEFILEWDEIYRLNPSNAGDRWLVPKAFLNQLLGEK